MSSAPRINLPRHAASYAAMYGLQKHVDAGQLPVQLHELVKMRASQINGCAFCIDMHAREAREHGEATAAAPARAPGARAACSSRAR